VGQAVNHFDVPDSFPRLDPVKRRPPCWAIVCEAIDDNMDVLVVRVAVRHDQRLVTVQAKGLENVVDSLFPLRRAKVLGGAHAEAEMVDGLLGAGMLVGVSSHDLGDAYRVFYTVNIASRDPGDAFGVK
jgi:hypothetical protein